MATSPAGASSAALAGSLVLLAVYVAFGLYLFGGLLELNPSLTYPNAPPYLFALCAVTALLALAAVLCFRWARRGKARGD